MKTMEDEFKERVRAYLAKYNIKAWKLADLADVGRWSVGRYVREGSTSSIMHHTFLKLSEYMTRHP